MASWSGRPKTHKTSKALTGKELAPTDAEREARARAGATQADRVHLERFDAALAARDAGAALRALEVQRQTDLFKPEPKSVRKQLDLFAQQVAQMDLSSLLRDRT